MGLAFFDFDGTISYKDSMIDFIRYARGDTVFLAGFFLLVPVLILYKFGLIPNYRAKEWVFTVFFRGMPRGTFLDRANRYSLERMPRIIRPKAMERIKWHRSQGYRVVVVSASVDAWLGPWCRSQGLDLIATGLACNGGRLTGKISGRNCHGEEKACRIRQAYDLSSQPCIYAYGDSAGDREMLAMAHKAYYKPFRA